MAKFWITDEEILAQIDNSRSLRIPPGETVEETRRFEKGNVRIFWKKSKEGLGGLTVKESDLESCAHAIE
jgi:hypothetical protein